MLQGNPFEAELEARWRVANVRSEAVKAQRGRVYKAGVRLYAWLKARITDFRLPGLNLPWQQPCENC
jgi:hypothetical protein